MFLFTFNLWIFKSTLHELIVSWRRDEAAEYYRVDLQIEENYHENRVGSKFLRLKIVRFEVATNTCKKWEEINKLTKWLFILGNELSAKDYLILFVLLWCQYTIVILRYQSSTFRKHSLVSFEEWSVEMFPKFFMNVFENADKLPTIWEVHFEKLLLNMSQLLGHNYKTIFYFFLKVGPNRKRTAFSD